MLNNSDEDIIFTLLIIRQDNVATVLPAKSDSDYIFCLESY